MDKSQPSSDRGGESSGNPYAKGGKATPIKTRDMGKHAEKVLNKEMNKTKAKKMYELADQLSKVDTTKLNEQQIADRSAMIKRLGEELKAMREAPADMAPAADPDQPEDISTAPEQHGNLNTNRLADILGMDARLIRAAIARARKGNMTRTDVMTMAQCFLALVNSQDDRKIQLVANILKAGNIDQQQEGAINQPPRKMDVPAYKRKAQGGDWKTSTQDLEKDKLRNISSSEWLKKQREDEKVHEEAATRVSKVFDFSDYKG